MKRLKLKEYGTCGVVYNNEKFLSEHWQWNDERYTQDAKHIIKLLEGVGYICSIKKAIELWNRFSDSRDATWLCLYKNDKYNLEAVLQFIEGYDPTTKKEF